jgi:hypothetical protein
MNKISVALYRDRTNAQALQRRLAEAGLDATLNDRPRLRTLWFVSREKADVRIEVPSEQFARAENCLLDWDAAQGALDGAIRCPECRSLRVQYPQYAQNSLLTNLAMGVLTELRAIEKHHYCEDCHFTWPREGYGARRNRPHAAPFYFIEGLEQTRLKSSAEQEDRDREAALVQTGTPVADSDLTELRH